MKKTFYAPTAPAKTLLKKVDDVVKREDFAKIAVLGSQLTVGLRS